MIPAQEAKKIAMESNAAVEAFLERLDPHIRESAECGLFRYVCSGWDSVKKTIALHNSERAPEPTIFQSKVIAALKGLGYHAAWGPTGNPEPPSRWGMDEEDIKRTANERYQTYSILIHW